MFERVLQFGGAIVLSKPGLITDLIGFAALATVLLSQQAFKTEPFPAARRPLE